MISEAQKKKILNLVAQGEAKNMQYIFYSPELRDGLEKILGMQNGERVIELLKNITRCADQKDWLTPYEQTIAAMQNNPATGLVSIS